MRGSPRCGRHGDDVGDSRAPVLSLAPEVTLQHTVISFPAAGKPFGSVDVGADTGG